MSDVAARIEMGLATVRHRPMAEWPQTTFDELGMMNPFTTGNLKQWRKAIAATRHLRGAIVECGTYRGESLGPLGWLLREEGDPRHLIGFDSFQGFPSIADEDRAEGTYLGRPDYFTRTSQADVQAFVDALGLQDRVTLVGGFFEDTLPRTAVGPVSVLILDCDLYESYRTCLRELYALVEPGGWILFDEYFNKKYPGARKAVDEFFADKPEKPSRDEELFLTDFFERWYVVKQ